MAKLPTSIQYSEQEILNGAFDPTLGILKTMSFGQTGSSAIGMRSDALAIKVTISSPITYVAYAVPGAAQSSAVWQALKVDETSGMVVTWADGNANFDNIVTDLTALTYS